LTDVSLAVPPKSRRRPAGPRRNNVWIHVVLIIGAMVMMFPFAWQIIMSLSTNAEVQSVTPHLWPAKIQWGNYSQVFHQLPFLHQLRNSVVITVIRVSAQIAFCTLAGYAFARMHFRGKTLVLGAVLSILMVPSQVYLLPQYQIVQNLGLLGSLTGLVLPGLFSAFGTFLMRTAFLALPGELEEAARLDGANPFQVFRHIMLPLIGPSISVLAITATLWSWNELLWPLVVTTDSDDMPLSAGLATLVNDRTVNYPIVLAASLLATAPVLILFIVLQRRVIDGLASSGLK
jgi:multiple sugar transport system permease protein